MTAVHRVIADDLRAAIRSGALAAGARLPTIRELGEQYGVTPQYAATALRTLATQGWIVVAQGRPSLVADTQPPDEAGTPTLAELARRVEVLEELHSSDTPSHQHP